MQCSHTLTRCSKQNWFVTLLFGHLHRPMLQRRAGSGELMIVTTSKPRLESPIYIQYPLYWASLRDISATRDNIVALFALPTILHHRPRRLTIPVSGEIGSGQPTECSFVRSRIKRLRWSPWRATWEIPDNKNNVINPDAWDEISSKLSKDIVGN